MSASREPENTQGTQFRSIKYILFKKYHIEL